MNIAAMYFKTARDNGIITSPPKHKGKLLLLTVSILILVPARPALSQFKASRSEDQLILYFMLRNAV